MAWDLIGDVHGRLEHLTAVLRALGYQQRGGAWRHGDPARRALFLGDLIDRGPCQTATLALVRAMVEAGSAECLLGNHEFNAIAYGLRDPQSPDRHLRIRSVANTRQHRHFLAEVGIDSATHRTWLEWFLERPLWLETDGLRAVHACWHAEHLRTLTQVLGPSRRLSPASVEAASRPGNPLFVAVEALCKGVEVDLPPGLSWADVGGTQRTRARVKWWDPGADTFRTGVLVATGQDPAGLPDDPLPSGARIAYDGAKPVFFGHYALSGTPQLGGPRTCCLDYSGEGHASPLVAYRWDGNPDLTQENIITAHAKGF